MLRGLGARVRQIAMSTWEQEFTFMFLFQKVEIFYKLGNIIILIGWYRIISLIII